MVWLVWQSKVAREGRDPIKSRNAAKNGESSIPIKSRLYNTCNIVKMQLSAFVGRFLELDELKRLKRGAYDQVWPGRR